MRHGFVITLAISVLFLAPATAEAVNTPTPPSPAVGAQDASGCNGSVCIYLAGSGLHVDSWRTRATTTSYTCTRPRYWRNGVIIRTGAQQCGPSGTKLYAGYGSGTFSHGDVLCNTWTNMPGKPCKTIRE